MEALSDSLWVYGWGDGDDCDDCDGGCGGCDGEDGCGGDDRASVGVLCLGIRTLEVVAVASVVVEEA